MKKNIFTFLILLLGISVFAQDVVISVPTQNTLLLDMINPLNVLVQDYDNHSLYLYTNNGKINKYDNKFDIQPKELGRTWISVNKITSTDTLEVKRLHFITIPLDRYVVTYVSGKSHNDLISKRHLIASRGIIGRVVGLDFDYIFRIRRYKLIAVRNSSPIFVRDVKSSEFTKQLKKDFETLETGDELYFVDMETDKLHNFQEIKMMKLIVK